MKNDLIIFSVLLTIVALMGGCGSFQLKSYTKSTNPLKIETSDIEKTVYFVFENNSPHPSQLDSMIRTKLEENGYKIVSDAQSASFSLKVTPVNINNDNGTEFDLANVAEVGENTRKGITKELKTNFGSGLETSLMGAAAGLVVTSFVGSLAYLTADGNIRMQVNLSHYSFLSLEIRFFERIS